FFTFLFSCAILQAQSLAEITAQKDFVLRTPQTKQEEVLPDLEENNFNQKETLLQVNKLPDIKLNEDILKKSVISYENTPDLQEAFTLYRQGDIDKSLLLLDINATSEAYANMALIYLQIGDFKQALKYIDKALESQETEEEPIYQLIKIWIYAAQNNYTQTEKEYQKLLFLTADFEYIYNAKLALATSAFFAKKYKQIAPLLENIYSSNPYAISHAAYLIGRVLFNKKAYKSAQTLLSQALIHDNNNYPALIHYGLTQEKLKEFIPAWQSFANILILDPKDKFALNKTKQLSKYLKNRPSAYLFYTKLDEIYTKEPSSIQSPLVRIGLFSDKQGILQPVKEFMLNVGQDFVIEDEKLGSVLSGKAFAPKTIVFNPQTKSVDINNKWGHKEFSTKRPFAIKTNNIGSTFLVKDPITENVFKTNLGDKELKGTLLVVPNDEGMQLVNYTMLEDILPSVLTQFSKGQKDQNTLQALAIILRTQIAKTLGDTQNALFDLADNTAAFYYGGINMQSAGNIEAVK
ncbi:MAG: tetratricopeptide repeat protein, partial [Campylobacter sp.]|nr:tetratricopeptide repeat protein [Campylobacter sp.]